MIQFLHQQTDELLGYLDGNEGRAYWDDEQKKEVGGLNVLSFTMPSDIEEARYADERNRIIVRHERGGWQEYIIYNTVTTGTEIRVVATGAEIEMNKLKVVTPKRHEAMPLAQMLSAGVDGIDWELGDIVGAGTQTREFDKFLGGYDFVKQVANTYGVELIFRTEVSGNRVVGRYIDAVQRAGESRGKEFVAGKDIINIEREMHADRIVTALFCVGPEPQDEDGNETGDERLTTLVTDPDAFQRWNRKGQHIIEVYEPQSDAQDMTMEQLISYGEEELRKRIAAVVEYKIEAADLSALYPHEEAYLADNVRVIDDEFVPPLYAEARIIAVTSPVIVDSEDPVEKTYSIGEVYVRRKEDVTRNFASIAKRYSTKIIRQDEPPTGAANTIWIQTGEDLPFDVAHAWNGEAWVAVTAQSAEDIGADPAGSADAALQTARGEIADVAERIDNIEDEIGEAFADGIIEEAEARSIAKYVNTLNADKQDVDSEYDELHGNPALSGAPKSNLADAKTAYNTAHTALIGAINQAILDEKATDAESANVDNKFDDYRSALGVYSTAFTVASNAVSSKHAADAQAAAVEAAAADAETKAAAAREAAQEYSDLALDDLEISDRNLFEGGPLETYSGEGEKDEHMYYADIYHALAKAGVGSTVTVSFDVQMTIGETLRLYNSNHDGEIRLYGSKTYNHIGTEKQRLSFTTEVEKNPAEEGNKSTKIEFFSVYGTGDWFTISNLKIQRGSKATDWTPAPEDLQAEAQRLAQEALEAAQTYADTAAGAAETAAKTHADAKAEAERVIAEAYADDVIDAEEAARIEEAEANLAAARTHANTAAEEALSSAKSYADTAAGNAETAAKAHADTKAEAERIIAEAHADDVVDAEETARIADVKARLEEAKTHADTAAATALSSAQSYADTAAGAAETAAKTHADTKAEAEREIAKAHADGIVDDEEAARIADVKARLATAKTYADTKKAEAIAAAQTYADTAAGNAETAAKTYADTKAEAERIIAEAHADDVVDAEEAARIQAVTDALAEAAQDASTKAQSAADAAETYADTVSGQARVDAEAEAARLAQAAQTAAQNYADTAAGNAETAAINAANVKAEAEREIAKAYADGIVDDEEAERIADVEARLVTAKAYADDKKQEAIDAAVDAAATTAQNKADEAQRLAEVYAATQVDDLEISDRNFMRNSKDTKGTTTREHMYYGRIDDALSDIGAGEKITISFDIRSTVEGEDGYVRVYNSNHRGQWGFTNPGSIGFENFGNAWTRVSFQAEVVFDELDPISETDIEFYSVYDTGRFFDVRKIKIQRGSKATDWTPAPEDVAADALAKANAARDEAIAAAEEYADLAAGAAETAAIEAANAETALAEERAKAHADGVVDDEEAARIKQAADNLAEAKQEAADKAAQALTAAEGYADTAAANAEAAAKTHADAKAEAERILAEAYADDKVTAEEQARIDDANRVLDEAKLHADQAADAVVDSENFKNELARKADAESLGDYATKNELDAVENFIPDAVQQGIDGIDFSDYATNESLQNTEEELRKSLSATTGLNMIRNSIGYAGLDYWEHTTAEEVVSTMMNEQLKTLGYGSGFYFPASSGAKGIQQTMRVRPGVAHTLSWFVNKATEGNFEVSIYEDGALKMTLPDVSAVDGEFDSNYIPYTPETGMVTVRFTADASLEATLTGVMMGLGDLPTQWTLANGELYNAYVRVDDSGLVVLRVDENGDVEGFTNMTPEEFAGYYDENRDGNFERIFYFNRDETVTKKLRAKEEITMGTIKIVRVEGTTNRGWAFVPIVRDDS